MHSSTSTSSSTFRIYGCHTTPTHRYASAISIRVVRIDLDDDRVRLRSRAEPAIEERPAARELVARPAAAELRAEADVARRGEARHARRVEADRAPGVHLAGPAADVLGALVAVGHDGLLRVALGESEGVDGRAGEGERCVGCGEPVHHLRGGEDVGGRLLDSDGWSAG